MTTKQTEDKILKILRNCIKKLLVYSFEENSLWKEADAKCYLYMLLFEEFKKKNMLFTEKGDIILRAELKYSWKGISAMDLAIMDPDNPKDKALYGVELKLWDPKWTRWDVDKLTKAINKKYISRGFIVICSEKIPKEDIILKKTEKEGRTFYMLSPKKGWFTQKNLEVYYSVIIDVVGKSSKQMELKKKDNITVLTNKGVLLD